MTILRLYYAYKKYAQDIYLSYSKYNIHVCWLGF